MADSVGDLLAKRGIASDDLTHYGVKGMKWGKRRSSKQLAAAQAKREDLSKLSDDDLKKKIARIKLEQEYTKLTSTPKGKSYVKAGASWTAKTLLKVGQKEAEDFLKDQGKKMVAEAIAKHAAKKAATAAIGALTK